MPVANLVIRGKRVVLPESIAAASIHIRDGLIVSNGNDQAVADMNRSRSDRLGQNNSLSANDKISNGHVVAVYCSRKSWRWRRQIRLKLTCEAKHLLIGCCNRGKTYRQYQKHSHITE